MYPTPSDSQPGNPLPSVPPRGFSSGAGARAATALPSQPVTMPMTNAPVAPPAPVASVNGAQVAPTAAAPTADTPHARGFTQVGADAFRQGNGYTDRAGAMGENQQALARLQAGNIPAAGFQSPAQQLAMPTVKHSGNDWEARNNLRSLRVSANSLTNDGKWGGRGGMAPDVAAYLGAVETDNAARQGKNPLAQELLQQQGGIVRTGLQEAGATGRTAMTEGGNMIRAGMTNNVQRAELGLKREAQGFTTRAAGRLEQAQQDYLNAKTPQERAQAAQSLRVLTGKDEQPTAPSGYRWAGANLQAIPGGPGDKTQQGKPMPTAAASGLLGNRENLRRAENALGLLNGEQLPGGATGDPNATGIKGYMPNQLLNRLDPKGVDTRAAIADLGSLIIHDRSGAAVTAAEFPRLAPFIPTEKDDPATARKKLEQFAKNYRATIDDTAEFYRQLGYNVPDDRQDQPQAQQPDKPQPQQPTGQPQSAQIPQAGEVRQGYRFRGGDPADRNAWEVAQ